MLGAPFKPGFGLSGIPQHSTRLSWSYRRLAVISSAAFPACHQALPPGRVPHVRGLSRTWVEHDLFPMLSPPVYTYLQGKDKGGASPGFPVEFGGVGEPHAAFLTESRTRGHVRCSVQEIRVAHRIQPMYAEVANMGHPSSYQSSYPSRGAWFGEDKKKGRDRSRPFG
jgi:hypothetical protein